MKLYSIKDLNQGSGLFDHLMRTGREHPSDHTDMPREVAIGVIAAATASGLLRSEIADIIPGYFGEQDTSLLEVTFNMFAGEDERIHLWNFSPDGRGRLHREIRRHAKPRWKLAQRRIPH